MSIPRVYQAINAITEAFARSGIAKLQTNAQDQYKYRGIDDVHNRLSPLLAEHRLCILPRVLERVCVDRNDAQGNVLISVSLRVAFDLVSCDDGSKHVIEAFGEALDGGDKGTSKAMSAAFKYAILQAFCIPVTGREDADAQSFRLKRPDVAAEPDQGWEQWHADILEIVRVCETQEALYRLQTNYRGLLKSLSAQRPALYSSIGEAVQGRRRLLSRPPAKTTKAKSNTLAAEPSKALANGAAAHG